jgi:RNA polymerase sigma-70 factor, ECF subfamily
MSHSDRQANVAASGRLDPDTFAALYQKAYGKLWLIAAAIVGDRSGAEDIVQESVLAAWQRVDQFEPGTNFAAWLARFVRWNAFNHARKYAGRNTRPADPHHLDLNACQESAEALDWENDRAGEISEYQTHFDDDVVHALRSVGDLGRACMLLRTVHQLSYREIAELLEIPEGTAMSHVHRTRRILRDRLLRYLPNEPHKDSSES